jgi:dihydroorotate dehydrogenase (NAD+) catalytic subunit
MPDIPIIGMGGIRSGHDALEFILAGANAVSVGTSIFNDPSAPARINSELAEQLATRGFSRLTDAISYAHRVGDLKQSTESNVVNEAESSDLDWDFITE